MTPLLTLIAALSAVPLQASSEGSLPVRVTIWEGLTDTWKGEPLDGTPSDWFEAPALGFVQLPKKVNERGIEIDRKSPFALKATAPLRIPRGRHELVLRAKGWSRLLIDGGGRIELNLAHFHVQTDSGGKMLLKRLLQFVLVGAIGKRLMLHRQAQAELSGQKRFYDAILRQHLGHATER